MCRFINWHKVKKAKKKALKALFKFNPMVSLNNHFLEKRLF